MTTVADVDFAALDRQTVEELTERTRNDPQLLSLKTALVESGHDPDRLLMFGLAEDESGNAFGAFIELDTKHMYEWERSTVRGEPARLRVWRSTEAEAANKYPEAEAAIDLAADSVVTL